MIKENIENIRKQLLDNVTLIAVSKTKPAEDIRTAYDCGIRDFGENKVQELLSKIDILPGDIRWHLIGHLQTNKVRQIIGKTYLIHSVDSIKLAKVIDSESAKKSVVTDVLLEINVGKEDSKYGFIKLTDDDLKELSLLKNIRIRGLMTVAPIAEDPENSRCIFRELKALSVDIEAKNIDNIRMEYLSMGMTGDFVVAMQEGSTHIRVGTAIFGKRNYDI